MSSPIISIDLIYVILYTMVLKLHPFKDFSRCRMPLAKLIYGRGKREHVSDLFQELHWLYIPERIIFKLILYVHKGLYGTTTPHYIRQAITCPTNRNQLLSIPRTKTKIVPFLFVVLGFGMAYR